LDGARDDARALVERDDERDEERGDFDMRRSLARAFPGLVAASRSNASGGRDQRDGAVKTKV
jgi:hypothetical protein